MDRLATEPASPPPPEEMSLGHTTARGFAWLLMNTVTIKIVTFFQIIVLGKLITREDYGLVGDTLTIGGLAAIIGTIAMDDLLVQRQKDFRRWATPGFWMSLTLGLVAAAAMIGIAPIGAKVYHSRQLIGLVIVAALAVPIQNLAYIPNATLRAQLRYRTLATVSWGQSLSQAIFTIVFAFMGWGAYSIIVARTASLAAQTTAVWCLARPQFRWALELREWPNLIGDGAWLLGSRACSIVVSNGDYMVLGALSLAAAGDYYFAFNLSMTTTMLLVASMGSVLMPTLCKLQDDPKRQTAVALQTVSAIALLALPVSFMQAVASGPILRLIWHQKWLRSVPILEILSVGMAFQVLGVPGSNLLVAQGRYRTQFMTSLASTILFFLLVVPGAMWKLGAGASVGVSIFFVLSQFGCLYVAIRPAGGTVGSIVKSCGPSLFAAAVAAGAAAIAAGQVNHSDDSRVANAVQLAIIAVVSVGVYYPLVRWLAPDSLKQLTNRAEALLPKSLRGMPRVQGVPAK